MCKLKAGLVFQTEPLFGHSKLGMRTQSLALWEPQRPQLVPCEVERAQAKSPTVIPDYRN